MAGNIQLQLHMFGIADLLAMPTRVKHRFAKEPSRPALLKKNRPNKDNKDILKSPMTEEVLHHWVTWYLVRIRAAEMLLSICPYLGKSLYRIIKA